MDFWGSLLFIFYSIMLFSIYFPFGLTFFIFSYPHLQHISHILTPFTLFPWTDPLIPFLNEGLEGTLGRLPGDEADPLLHVCRVQGNPEPQEGTDQLHHHQCQGPDSFQGHPKRLRRFHRGVHPPGKHYFSGKGRFGVWGPRLLLEIFA